MRRLLLPLLILAGVALLLAIPGRNVRGRRPAPSGPIGGAAVGPEKPELVVPEAVTLPRGAVLAGRVIDPDDRPVPGARAAWFLAEERPLAVPPSEMQARCGVTDGEGRFRLRCPDVESLVLVIRHHLHRPLTCSAAPRDGGAEEGERTYRLESGGSITGRVVTKAGEGVAGARVVAIGRGYRRERVRDIDVAFWGPGIDVSCAVSAADGEFSLSGLAESLYEVEAIVPGMMREKEGTFHEPVLLRPGARHRFTVYPCAIAAYRLIDSTTGRPLAIGGMSYPMPNIPYETGRYLCEEEVWCGGAPLGNRADPSGTSIVVQLFPIRDFPLPTNASATVRTFIPGYEKANVEIPLQAPWSDRAIVIHDVKLTPGPELATIRVRFTDGRGEPLEGVRILLSITRPEDLNPTVVDCVPGKGGVVSILLPPGAWSLVEPEGGSAHWSAVLRPVTPSARTEWELTLRSAIVLLRMIDASGEPIRPIAHARVSSAPGPGPVVLRSYGFPGGGSMTRDASAPAWGPRVVGSRSALIREAALPEDVAGQRGPFPPGTRTFEFFCPRYAPARETVDLKPGTVHRVTAVMQPSDGEWFPPFLTDDR